MIANATSANSASANGGLVAAVAVVVPVILWTIAATLYVGASIQGTGDAA